MNRFTISARRTLPEDISVILICSERSVSRNLSLKRVDGDKVINHNIKTIKKYFGETIDLIVITGYEGSSIDSLLNRTLRTVHNYQFDDLDVNQSILIGLKNTTSKNVYIVDCSKKITGEEFLPADHSYIVICDKGDIGVSIQDDKISHLSFGLPDKVGCVIYLKGDDINSFLRNNKDTLLLYEVLNNMIDSGSIIKPVRTKI